jgi:hypothetical protein
LRHYARAQVAEGASQPEEPNRPTDERLNHAGGFLHKTGRGKSNIRYSMLDDSLGRAWMRQKISDEEYSALKRYALHWLAGGLQGSLNSIDLDRVFAFDPALMSGLAKSERQQDHRDAYRDAKAAIGKRLGVVADQVACAGTSLSDLGLMLGYHSKAHGRYHAAQALAEAGYRLGRWWKDQDKRR